MALVTPVAGAYTSTFNRNGAGAAALNYTRQGFNINITQKGERIEETDLFGLCLIDVIARGAQATIDCICKIYNSVTVGAMFPWSAGGAFGSIYTVTTNPIGMLANSTPDVLILTAVAGTPAAATPASLTANVTISPDNNMQIIFNSVLREVPLKFDCLLVDSAGVAPQSGSLFTVT